MPSPASRLYSYTGPPVSVGADTAEDVLFSYTLPAGTVTDDGSFLEFMADGNCAPDTAKKYIRYRVNGAFLASMQIALNENTWRLEVRAVKAGPNILCSKLGASILSGLPGTGGQVYVTAGAALPLSIDWTQDVMFTLTAQNSTEALADSIVGDGFLVMLWP